MISDNQFIKNKYVANFSWTLRECPYSPVVLVYFLNCCCHACILGWCLHNLRQCWGKKRKRKKEIKKKQHKNPQDLSRKKKINLLQEFQPKGTELSIVLGVLLPHLLALWIGQWLVSFDRTFYGKRTAESEKATRLCNPEVPAWAAPEEHKEREEKPLLLLPAVPRESSWPGWGGYLLLSHLEEWLFPLLHAGQGGNEFSLA